MINDLVVYTKWFSDSNPEEVIESLKNSFYDNYNYIHPISLDQTVRLFRDLGYTDLADEIISYYIQHMENKPLSFSLRDNLFSSEIKDSKLIEAFNKAYIEPKVEKSLKDILLRVSMHHLCDNEDLEKLIKASDDEFYNLFKSTEGDELLSIINAGLQFGKISDSTNNYKNIYESIRNALTLIGKESPLNALRVSKYGINLSNC